MGLDEGGDLKNGTKEIQGKSASRERFLPHL